MKTLKNMLGKTLNKWNNNLLKSPIKKDMETVIELFEMSNTLNNLILKYSYLNDMQDSEILELSDRLNKILSKSQLIFTKEYIEVIKKHEITIKLLYKIIDTEYILEDNKYHEFLKLFKGFVMRLESDIENIVEIVISQKRQEIESSIELLKSIEKGSDNKIKNIKNNIRDNLDVIESITQNKYWFNLMENKERIKYSIYKDFINLDEAILKIKEEHQNNPKTYNYMSFNDCEKLYSKVDSENIINNIYLRINGIIKPFGTISKNISESNLNYYKSNKSLLNLILSSYNLMQKQIPDLENYFDLTIKFTTVCELVNKGRENEKNVVLSRDNTYKELLECTKKLQEFTKKNYRFKYYRINEYIERILENYSEDYLYVHTAGMSKSPRYLILLYVMLVNKFMKYVKEEKEINENKLQTFEKLLNYFVSFISENLKCFSDYCIEKIIEELMNPEYIADIEKLKQIETEYTNYNLSMVDIMLKSFNTFENTNRVTPKIFNQIGIEDIRIHTEYKRFFTEIVEKFKQNYLEYTVLILDDMNFKKDNKLRITYRELYQVTQKLMTNFKILSKITSEEYLYNIEFDLKFVKDLNDKLNNNQTSKEVVYINQLGKLFSLFRSLLNNTKNINQYNKELIENIEKDVEEEIKIIIKEII